MNLSLGQCPFGKNPTLGALAGQSAEFFHRPVESKSTQKYANRKPNRKLRRSKSWRTTAYDSDDESYSAISQSPFVSNRNKVRQRMKHKRTMLQTIQEKPFLSKNNEKSVDCKTKRSIEKKVVANGDFKPKGILKKPKAKNHRVDSRKAKAKLGQQQAANIMLGIVSGLGNVENDSLKIKDRSHCESDSSPFTPPRIKKGEENSNESMCAIYTPCYCEDCFNVELSWETKECISDQREKRHRRNYHPRSSSPKSRKRKCRNRKCKAKGKGRKAKLSQEATFLNATSSFELDEISFNWPSDLSPSPSPLKPRPRLFDFPSLPPDKGSESMGSLEYSSDEGREDKESTTEQEDAKDGTRFSWPDCLFL